MIRIFKAEHEIEVVKETLTLKRDNRFMDNDFKIQSNSYPFMIIENEATRLALGSKESVSVNRSTYHEVQVITPEGNFVGELQILTYTKNFRKCNLRFFSPLYKIKDEKINTFLPDRITTHPYLFPTYGYEEKRTVEIEPEFSNTWGVYGGEISVTGFPETLFNLPTIFWKEKYGTELNEDDDWYNYSGVINKYNFEDGNRYSDYNAYIINEGINFYNVTVNAPKIYLLSPLKKSVEKVGYKLSGSFVESDFIQKILVDSKNDNLTEIEINNFITDIEYTGIYNETSNNVRFSNELVITDVVKSGKKYRIDIKAKKILNVNILSYVSISSPLRERIVNFFEDIQSTDFETVSVEFEGVESETNENILTIHFEKFAFFNNANDPLEVEEFKIYEIAKNKGFSTHPIINLQRYCPEWSFVDYLNECKKLFNLKVTTNDHEKTLNIDFFENRFSDYTGIKLESILIDDFDSVEFDSILLKYDNVHDEVVFVSKSEIKTGQLLQREHTKEVSSKFKYLPVEISGGLKMSEFIEDKGGVGLMIYNHTIFFYTLPLANYNYNGVKYDLTLKNIFENFHRKSFTNYLSGGVFPAKGVFDQRTIKMIAKDDFVFIDNKRYYVNSMQYKELSNGLYATDLELLLMLY